MNDANENKRRKQFRQKRSQQQNTLRQENRQTQVGMERAFEKTLLEPQSSLVDSWQDQFQCKEEMQQLPQWMDHYQIDQNLFLEQFNTAYQKNHAPFPKQDLQFWNRCATEESMKAVLEKINHH